MQRRDLLKRLPALPLVIGAALSQAPAFVKSLAQQGAAIPQSEEVTMATRLRWFTSFIQGWGLNFRPNVAMPDEAEAWSPAIQRAWSAWGLYLRHVADSAIDNKIPPDMAAKIANVPEHMLRELMH